MTKSYKSVSRRPPYPLDATYGEIRHGSLLRNGSPEVAGERSNDLMNILQERIDNLGAKMPFALKFHHYERFRNSADAIRQYEAKSKTLQEKEMLIHIFGTRAHRMVAVLLKDEVYLFDNNESRLQSSLRGCDVGRGIKLNWSGRQDSCVNCSEAVVLNIFSKFMGFSTHYDLDKMEKNDVITILGSLSKVKLQESKQTYKELVGSLGIKPSYYSKEKDEDWYYVGNTIYAQGREKMQTGEKDQASVFRPRTSTVRPTTSRLSVRDSDKQK